MEPREVLEAQVAVVATLGKLAAIVTAPRRSAWPILYQTSLHEDLRRFIWCLHRTLDQCSVTSLGQRGVSFPGRHGVTFLGQCGVTSLSQAVAALRANTWFSWPKVTATVRAWQESVDALEESWFWLIEEAADLLDGWEDAAKATTKATATSLAGDQQDRTTSGGTAGDNLVAMALQPPVALAKEKAALVAMHEGRVAAATKVMEEAKEATSQAGAATRRGQQAKVARGLLGHLVVMCDRASLLPLELHDRLMDIEAILEEKRKVAPNILNDVVAAVTKAERMWEASACLSTHHLLGILGDIQNLLSGPCGSSNGPGGPCGDVVAKQCQKAIEDIPRLLGEQ